MYAGLAGVLYALSIGSVAPDSFGLELSVQFLAMIVLGGLGSVGGAVLGAIFVSALPLVFQQYAGSLPFIGSPGEAGIVASQAAAFLYGVAIVLVVLFEPGGLAGLAAACGAPAVPPACRRGGRSGSRSATTRSTTESRQTDQHKGAPREARKRRRRGTARLGRWSLAASGCSTKASDNSASGTQGRRRQDRRGVEGNTITLGVLTDLTGVFAALGKDITNAQALYWKDHKVCGKYTVKLDVKDNGYDTQKGIQLYSCMHNDVLAIEQTIGSPINTALLPQFDGGPHGQHPGRVGPVADRDPGIAVVGATYEVEMINVFDYLLKEGKLKEGDKIGHIYFEGEYGAGGLDGSKYFAKQNGMKIVEQQIQSTDTDMTAQVTKLKAEGVKAIALTVAPGQTASVAGVAAAQGLDVPIVGNNPVFAPGLLQGPAANWLKKNLYVASPVAPFDKLPDLLKAYQAAYPDDAEPRCGRGHRRPP